MGVTGQSLSLLAIQLKLISTFASDIHAVVDYNRNCGKPELDHGAANTNERMPEMGN